MDLAELWATLPTIKKLNQQWEHIQGAFHTSVLIVLWGAANAAEKTETSLSWNRQTSSGWSSALNVLSSHCLQPDPQPAVVPIAARS